jgi:hypothetical protein
VTDKVMVPREPTEEYKAMLAAAPGDNAALPPDVPPSDGEPVSGDAALQHSALPEDGDSGNEVVGHKTFSDGSGGFRHEALTRKEADALRAHVEEQKERRAADMPTEQDAVNALWRAWYRLKELGWQESTYAHDLKREGVESLLVEMGSSGIHRGHYHAVNGKDVWWIGPDGSPSHPCLVRKPHEPS